MWPMALQNGLIVKKSMRYDYIRQPDEIYKESFRLIREAVDLSAYDQPTAKLVERLVHTNGRPDIVSHLKIHDQAIQAGIRALQSKAPVFCDARMVAEGIIKRLLPDHNAILCTLDQVPYAEDAKDTRSARAVELWDGYDQLALAGSVVAIGNAPTALYRLLELLHSGATPPAVIIAMPVGFVGAADSKQALLDDFPHIPHIVLTGREGGSAYAAAAVNAIAGLSGKGSST